MVVPEPSGHDIERIERLRRAMYSRALGEKLHDRDRRTLDQERQLVGEDWRRPEVKLEGLKTAPRGMSVIRNTLWWMLGIAVVFFLGAGGFFLYYFTLGGGSVPASPQNVDIEVSGPPQVAGGETTELQIVVTNRNNVPLELADLVVTFPPGTRYATDFSTDQPTLRKSLGTIEPGGKRQGTISAVFSGAEGAHALAKIEIEYHVNGSNAVFVANNNYVLNFSSAPITLSVEGNSQTVAGQPVQLTVTITSNANAPMKDVLLAAAYPFGFKFSSATPGTVRDQNVLWALGDLAPGQKKTVTVFGTLSGNTGDDRVFRFTAGTRSFPSHQAIDATLSDFPFHVSISQPFLQLSTTVNGSSDPNVTVTPGSDVTVVVNYQNNLQTPVTDAVIVAKLSGIQIDGSTVKAPNGFYRSADDAVFWDKTTSNGILSTLGPGAKGFLSFSFHVPSGDDLKNVTNPHMAISINAAGNRVSETGVPQVLQSTSRQNIALASDLELIAEGLYYTNPFGSTGPMPPKASAETTYAIVFTVRNTTNTITDASVTATLPPYVRWVGIYSPSTENVTFNQLNSTLTWHIGTIAPHAGLDAVAPRQAAIAIGFTPSTSQIGQQPALLRNIVLKGTDASSSTEISKSVEDVSTNLSKVSKSSPDISVAGESQFTSTNATVVK